MHNNEAPPKPVAKGQRPPTVRAVLIAAASQREVRRYIYDDWSALLGEEVELRLRGLPVCSGIVDAVSPDSSMLWLVEASQQIGRRLYLREDGFEVWIDPRDLQPR